MAPNIAMHLSRLQVLLVNPLSHGGQVMASVMPPSVIVSCVLQYAPSLEQYLRCNFSSLRVI